MSQIAEAPRGGLSDSGAETIKMAAERRPLRVQSWGLTDPGRVRPGNEDQFLIAHLNKAMQVQQTSLPQAKVRFGDEQGHLFVVADGMGGHAGGEKASALVVGSIEAFVLNTLKWFFQLRGGEADAVVSEFQEALRQADARIFDEMARHPELTGMGSTLTMAYSLDSELFVAHVGDSRCYLLRGGELHRLTRDHTVVQEMIQHGLIEPEQASRHALRHVITNVVGGHEPGLNAEVHKLYLEGGDVILVCSDGLTEMVPDDEIRPILHDAAEPKSACERLVERANAKGGRDNITVVVARYLPIE